MYSCGSVSKVMLIAFLIHGTLAQGNGDESCEGITKGQRYAVVYTGNHFNDPANGELSLIVVAFSKRLTTVTLSSEHLVDGWPYSTTFYIDGGSSVRVDIPFEFILGSSSERSKRVVEVVADNDVSVYGLNYAPHTTDAFLAIPVSFLGVSYVAMSYSDRDDMASLFAVVGVENDTVVNIVLTAGMVFEGATYVPGDTLKLTLQTNEVVQIVASPASDYIGGSVIESDKPIALFGGSLCANTPGSYCDTLAEQLVPVESWGKTYMFGGTGNTWDQSIYTIHSYFQDTKVNIPYIGEVILQPGEFWQGDLHGTGVFTADQSFAVMQSLKMINGQIVDPSIIQLPSQEQFSYVFGFSTPPKSGGDDEGFFNFLNIIVKSDEHDSVRVNDEYILRVLSNNIEEHTIEGTDYNVFTVQIPKGEAVYFVEQLTLASPISVVVYGYERDETYGYSAGLFLPFSDRLLDTDPFYLREVGGEHLALKLPCRGNTVAPGQNPACLFQVAETNHTVEGHFLDESTVVCRTPRFHHVSFTSVDLSLDGGKTHPFRGNSYVLTQEDIPPAVIVEQSDQVIGTVDFTALGSYILLSWDPLNLQVDTVDVFLQIASPGNSDQGFEWTQDLLIAEDVGNTGSYTFRPDDVPQLTLDHVSQYQVSPVVIVLRHSDFSIEDIYHVLSSGFLKVLGEKACEDWYDVFYGTIIDDNLTPCPCTHEQALVDGNFEIDLSTDLSYLHVGVLACVRSTVGSDSGGQHCCYGFDGNILFGPPNGGTADTFALGNSLNYGTIWHEWHDVLPWFSCCQFENECRKYYQHRPSDDCTSYVPPRPTTGTGDPHITSLDRFEYTFNGAGEFLLLKSDLFDLTFQARMEVLAGTNATVYTAFVLKSNISDVIQIERSSLVDSGILVNGSPFNLHYKSYLIRRQSVPGAKLGVNDDITEVRVRLDIGVALLVRITPDMMSFILQLPDIFQNRTEGLLGNYNGIGEDDLMLPDGSWLPSNATLHAIHFDFGLPWNLEESSSLFTYRAPSDFFTYHNPGFIPNLEFPDVDDVSEEVKEVCGNSQICLFDAVTSGSLTLANDSMHDEEYFETVAEQSVKIETCGFPGFVDNGHINGSYLVGSSVSVDCFEGFSVNGSNEIVCLSNGTWFGELPECVVDCGSPRDGDDGFVVVGDVFQVGSVVNVSCPDGYSLVGADLITCETNGSWSDEPECIRDGLSLWMITVIALGGLVVVVVVLVTIVCLCKKGSSKNNEESAPTSQPAPPYTISDGGTVNNAYSQDHYYHYA